MAMKTNLTNTMKLHTQLNCLLCKHYRLRLIRNVINISQLVNIIGNIFDRIYHDGIVDDDDEVYSSRELNHILHCLICRLKIYHLHFQQNYYTATIKLDGKFYRHDTLDDYFRF